MEKFRTIIFIFAVFISLSALIEKIKLPNSIFLVLTVLAIGFIPALPDLEMDPGIDELKFSQLLPVDDK
ncbi:MAG: hypothetical protein ACHQFX_05630 [Chitinophagales bacterium]